MAFLVFVQRYRNSDSFWVSILFPAFGRTLWALSVCVLIVAGSTEHRYGLKLIKKNSYCNTLLISTLQGIVSRILNAKILLPFSRMTFAAYLLNPLIVLLVTMSCENSFHLDFYTITIFTIGFYFITYIAAFVFMMLFENPIVMFIRKFAE